jgi:hypothetical protein
MKFDLVVHTKTLAKTDKKTKYKLTFYEIS